MVVKQIVTLPLSPIMLCTLSFIDIRKVRITVITCFSWKPSRHLTCFQLTSSQRVSFTKSATLCSRHISVICRNVKARTNPGFWENRRQFYGNILGNVKNTSLLKPYMTFLTKRKSVKEKPLLSEKGCRVKYQLCYYFTVVRWWPILSRLIYHPRPEPRHTPPESAHDSCFEWRRVPRFEIWFNKRT